MANLGESAASAPAANPSGAVGIVRDLRTAVDVADFATIDALLLAQCPPDQPIMDAVRTVVVEFNRFDSAQVHWHRKHMELILKVPALQAHSTLRYREWRDVVADFVRERSGACPGDRLPRAVAHCARGAAVAGYEHWLAHPDTELTDVLEQSLHSLSLSFNLA